MEEVRCFRGVTSDRVRVPELHNQYSNVDWEISRHWRPGNRIFFTWRPGNHIFFTPACEYEHWFSDLGCGNESDKQFLLLTLRELISWRSTLASFKKVMRNVPVWYIRTKANAYVAINGTGG